MIILLEYYSANNYFKNLLTVLLDYINLFSMVFLKNEYLSEYLLTKFQHNARIIIIL